jgi:hypothetical protein
MFGPSAPFGGVEPFKIVALFVGSCGRETIREVHCSMKSATTVSLSSTRNAAMEAVASITLKPFGAQKARGRVAECRIVLDEHDRSKAAFVHHELPFLGMPKQREFSVTGGTPVVWLCTFMISLPARWPYHTDIPTMPKLVELPPAVARALTPKRKDNPRLRVPAASLFGCSAPSYYPARHGRKADKNYPRNK